MDGWKFVALGDVLGVQNGFAFKSKYFGENDGMPLIRIRDLKNGSGTVVNYTGDYDSQYVVEPGDLLIGMDGEFRCHEWKGQSALLNQRVCKLINFSEILFPRFLFYGINNYLKEIEDRTSFTTVKHLSSKTIKSIFFPLPPLEEQRRIAAVLDEAFEGLDRARAHAEANLNDANELFEEELGRVFSMNGKGWKVEKIGDICTLKSGKTVSKDRELPAGGIPYVKVGDMNLEANSNGITTSTRFLDREAISNNQIFPKGTTIFPKRGGAIMTNKKRIVLKEICADLNVMGVMPGKEIKADFLHYYFLSLDMRQIGSGAAVPQINNYDIAPLELQYPADLNEQSRIVEMITMLRHRTSEAIQAYTCQLGDLDSLRQSLLQRAFAGELT